MTDREVSKASTSNDRLLRREFEECCSKLNELEHRFNSRRAEWKATGRNPDPQEITQNVIDVHELGAAMAVKVVTTYESASQCIDELDAL